MSPSHHPPVTAYAITNDKHGVEVSREYPRLLGLERPRLTSHHETLVARIQCSEGVFLEHHSGEAAGPCAADSHPTICGQK